MDDVTALRDALLVAYDAVERPWSSDSFAGLMDDLIAAVEARAALTPERLVVTPATLVDEARANHVRWEHEAEVLEECNRPLCLGARMLLWPDPENPRVIIGAPSVAGSWVAYHHGYAAHTALDWRGCEWYPCKEARAIIAALATDEAVP